MPADLSHTYTVTSRAMLPWRSIFARPRGSISCIGLVDPYYRLLQPGQSQQDGTALPAGDPKLAVKRFGKYLRKRAAILGHVEQLPPRVSEADLDDAEPRIRQSLPADLRALYLIANGDAIGYDPCYLFGGNTAAGGEPGRRPRRLSRSGLVRLGTGVGHGRVRRRSR